MAGLLSRIAGGANKFAGELLDPSNALGRLGVYLGAAGGGDLGNAALAFQQDKRQQGDTELERQIKEMQLERLRHPLPPNNDTEADFRFFSQFGPESGKQFIQSKLDPIVSVPLPSGGLYNGPRSGLMTALAGTPQSQPNVPTTLPPDFDFGSGGPTQPASGGFRR